MKKRLYIIAGCNGAGKTTASLNILPEILECKEFVNADEIAKGLSPFQPENVAIEAGRIMLSRIEELLDKDETFALETTLSTKSHRKRIEKAKERGYKVHLVFFWLDSMEMAKMRVQKRVDEGGHNIPEEIIERRYKKGIINLFDIYSTISDELFIFDNSEGTPIQIYKKIEEEITEVNSNKYSILKEQYNEFK